MSKLLNIFMLLLILALICPASLPVEASTGSDSTLLQYTGGGHVLGFSEGEFYVATGDHALKVEFVNGLAVQPVAESAGSGQNVAPLDKVTYQGIWKDIDIVYTCAANGIAESTYYLNTPASVDGIRLRYNRPVSLDGQGNLVISFENGNMVESAPVAWQETGGQRMGVQANYVIYDEHEIGFALAGCRPGVAVTIDPTLTWNTFLGGNQGDSGNAITVDASGNIYIAGSSNATWGNPVRAYSDRGDAFVARLNPSGALLWNTFLGGDERDNGSGIALDRSGNICVAGTSLQHGDHRYGHTQTICVMPLPPGWITTATSYGTPSLVAAAGAMEMELRQTPPATYMLQATAMGPGDRRYASTPGPGMTPLPPSLTAAAHSNGTPSWAAAVMTLAMVLQ